MDYDFFLRIIVSFIVAGIWITLATLLSEKLGSKIGGLLTNLPSNLLISWLFVASTQGPLFVSDAALSVPIGMTIGTIFLFVFIVSLKYGIKKSVLISLMLWLILAFFASLINYTNLFASIMIYIAITVSSFFILEKVIMIPTVKNSPKSYSASQLLSRAIFAGGVVAGVVILSKYLSPYNIGIFSTFPAVLLSTMIILSTSQGPKFAQCTGKILILSSSNIIIYAIAVHFTYPAFGVVVGTIVSFSLAFLWVWLFFPIIRKLA